MIGDHADASRYRQRLRQHRRALRRGGLCRLAMSMSFELAHFAGVMLMAKKTVKFTQDAIVGVIEKIDNDPGYFSLARFVCAGP
jgi:hypothetical protein